VSNADVESVYERLVSVGLAEAGAGTISDVTSCPGTDTCKLGISSSRGLAKQLRTSLQLADAVPETARNLHIKCSGCFNSCGQHHVADIGFLGVSRNVSGRRVPHFQLVVGGAWKDNASEFGLAIGAIPSKRVPEAVRILTEAYASEQQDGEEFRQWVHRVGRRHVKELVASTTKVAPFEEQPDLYKDWGDPRTFTIGDIGVGECAGEVISPAQFALDEGERFIFEAQLLLDESQPESSLARSLSAMFSAARASCLPWQPGLSADADKVGETFDRLLGKTGRFDAAFPGGNFSRYFVQARKEEGAADLARARKQVEEAQMFLDAAHEFHAKGLGPEPVASSTAGGE